jgi:uncharacterized protein (DUF427 family)
MALQRIEHTTMGHAADSYHRIDIRQAFRRLVVRHGDRIIADTKRPVVLYESGFARAGMLHAPISITPH